MRHPGVRRTRRSTAGWKRCTRHPVRPPHATSGRRKEGRPGRPARRFAPPAVRDVRRGRGQGSCGRGSSCCTPEQVTQTSGHHPWQDQRPVVTMEPPERNQTRPRCPLARVAIYPGLVRTVRVRPAPVTAVDDPCAIPVADHVAARLTVHGLSPWQWPDRQRPSPAWQWMPEGRPRRVRRSGSVTSS